MLSQRSIKEFSAQLHTHELNVMREYLQNLLLSLLFQQTESDNLAFKGGTALRLLYGSPRFSEDLDFSSNLSEYHVKIILQKTFQSFQKEAISHACLESKKTTGGFFALYKFSLYDKEIPIEWNISLRTATRAEAILVTTPMIPHYQCMALPIKTLAQEKIEALFRRKKPRDFFDLYFLLRERRGLESIIPLKKRLIEEVDHLNPRTIKQELRLFLPTTHHALLNSFPKALASELARL